MLQQKIVSLSLLYLPNSSVPKAITPVRELQLKGTKATSVILNSLPNRKLALLLSISPLNISPVFNISPIVLIASEGLFTLPLGRFFEDSVKKSTRLALDPKSDSKLFSNRTIASSILEVPICYSEEFGLDIQNLKIEKDLTIQEIVGLHSSVTYKVKMIGFTPGFAYLGDLPDELLMPRLTKPRVNLLPGSVGISGNRTGVYTLGGPGGWRIIGRTPKSLFDPNKKNPFGISAGMKIKFKAITKRQYENYSNEKTK